MRMSGWKAIFLVMKEPQKIRAPPMMPITGQALFFWWGRWGIVRVKRWLIREVHTCCRLRAWAAARLQYLLDHTHDRPDHLHTPCPRARWRRRPCRT